MACNRCTQVVTYSPVQLTIVAEWQNPSVTLNWSDRPYLTDSGYWSDLYYWNHSKKFWLIDWLNKKHLKNVGPIHHCKPPHANSPDVASGTVARRLSIDVHDNNDNAW